MSIGSPAPRTAVAPTTWAVPDLTVARAALWLSLTVVLAALAYYFIGYDQGAVSVFGQDTHVHEFVHDARHFLGFPCH
ncbi:CbtB-domain containing protein [Gordonia sp. CPCC 205515]|uniref:CbtB domain-containing protein n=1 Tax=Gordonia sp. CPCC 205515 TaxID=3140791 RepID=UPI003AF384F4